MIDEISSILGDNKEVPLHTSETNLLCFFGCLT